MLRWPSSIRVRLTLWYSLLLAVPLVAFALLSYAAFSRALVSGTDRFIGEALEAFTRELGAERRTGLSLEEAMGTTIREVRFRELHITIFDPQWRVVGSAGPPDEAAAVADDETLASELRAPHVGGLPVLLTLGTGFISQRVRAQPLVLDGQPCVIAGQYPLRESVQMMTDVRRMFGVAIPLIILVAAVSGWFLAQRSLAPVGSMANHAAVISATNLHERLPVSG